MAKYDYIIVGAGSAGCVLANRLSADVNNKVCLLEAGGSDRSIFVKMPAALTFLIESDTYNWKFEGEPEEHLDGRKIGQARGKGLGGSSSINGMVYVRGNPKDFDSWKNAGVDGWDFPDCLPYFKKLESFEGGADPNRGGNGPLHVIRSPAKHVFYDTFLKAGEEYGLPRAGDYNSSSQEGVHVTQATIKDGVRCSSASAYLRPAMRRPNLTVKTKCLVHRIVFEGQRAVGIEFSNSGRLEKIEANREIILSAGAFGSPHILMLSGVGDSDHLGEHEIPVVNHLPGVGQNMEDHVVAPVRFKSNKPVSINRQLGLVGRAKLGLEWLLFKKGLGASSFFEVGTFFKSNDNVDYVNMQHEFLPFLADFQHGKVVLSDGFQYFVSQMRPNSRGSVRLKSADPAVYPAIHFNFLAEQADIDQMIEGIKITREIAHQSAWDDYRSNELEPGPEIVSDTDLTAWLRGAANTEHHPACTCRMGTDDLAVTDNEGRVHGTEGLRVVDASILPKIPTANINAAVIMSAEKVSDMILGMPPLKAEHLQNEE